MATLFATIKFTDKGMAEIKDTLQRAEKFQKHALKMGVEVKEILWTQGPFDGLLILEAPDDLTATALMARVCSAGFIHTQTSRAYRADEMKAVLDKI